MSYVKAKRTTYASSDRESVATARRSESGFGGGRLRVVPRADAEGPRRGWDRGRTAGEVWSVAMAASTSRRGKLGGQQPMNLVQGLLRRLRARRVEVPEDAGHGFGRADAVHLAQMRGRPLTVGGAGTEHPIADPEQRDDLLLVDAPMRA